MREGLAQIMRSNANRSTKNEAASGHAPGFFGVTEKRIEGVGVPRDGRFLRTAHLL